MSKSFESNENSKIEADRTTTEVNILTYYAYNPQRGFFIALAAVHQGKEIQNVNHLHTNTFVSLFITKEQHMLIYLLRQLQLVFAVVV